MDSTHSSIPFDPDFDAKVSSKATEQQTQRPPSGSVEISSTSPVLTFYLGLACSVLLFGAAGVIWMLIVLS